MTSGMKSDAEAALSGETLSCAPSPHLRDRADSATIMRDVVLALLPAVCGSIFLFGGRVVPYYLISVMAALLFDWLWRRFVRGGRYVFDYTPVVTGTLLAMSLPVGAPWWFPVLGNAAGIIIAKELFGGVGRNFLNPAIFGRLVLRLLFVDIMTTNAWPRPVVAAPPPVDAISGATPLMIVKDGGELGVSGLLASFWGNVGGKIGETSAALLLLGASFLFWRRIINWRIPVAMLSTIAIGAWLFAGRSGLLSSDAVMVAAHLLGGASIIGAFFMATDYSSSPATAVGQILFGVGVGILTMAYRLLGSYSEGFTFALFAMNLTVPFLDRLTVPRVWGEK